MFKLIRESTHLTQARLAETLIVDVATVQGWESGRRPLGALRSADLVRLRMSMRRLGAPAVALAVLDLAIEADLILFDAVEAGPAVLAANTHPLAAVVHRRTLTSLLTWPFTGIVPGVLAVPRQTARRGPVADRPLLGSEERARFFDHLQVTADASRGTANALLRRQAVYLLGFDQRPDSARWLTSELQDANRGVGRADHLSSWVAHRSSAIALAQKGHRDALDAFVARKLSTDAQEIANLNYWAYWLGEIPDPQVNDDFMTTVDPEQWFGARVLDHLLDRLNPGSHHADLNIHTLWALLLARPIVLRGRRHAQARAGEVVDRMSAHPHLTHRARRELDSVAYAIRLADR
ncbi:helix-turn-helix domain-containing protein [Actinokineospora sp.]|uniref:helix-turn-helix domain-containing protein n=1 Tax=Actinokineospora sp. TaxID=1872133 RepID=UPI003D6B71E3